MRKIREVLRLKYELGFTHRTIAKALRVAVGTVSEYLAKAKKGGLSWPLPEELSDGELEAGLFPPPGSSGARPGLDYAHIHEELRRHRELTLLQLWVVPMLTPETIEKMNAMKLFGLVSAFETQLSSSEYKELSFEERVGLLVDAEWTAREQRKLSRQLRAAKLRYPACLENVNFQAPRG